MKRILRIGLILLSFAASLAAQTKIVPIVDMKIGGLLGGVQNGEFFDAKTTVEKLSAEQNYTLYLPVGKSENLLLKKPANSQDVCEDFFALDYSQLADNRHEKGGVALGDGFRWNPQPRAAKLIDLNSPEYKKIMSGFLRTKRITFPLSKLTQAMRVDLDGDGQEEVILTASRVISYEDRKPNARNDEYSVVLVRKIVGGKPQTIVVGGEFYPKSDAEYDGFTYAVPSVADLNGDGKMEIILHGEYYEGSSTQVFEIVGGKATRVDVLSADCGV